MKTFRCERIVWDRYAIEERLKKNASQYFEQYWLRSQSYPSLINNFITIYVFFFSLDFPSLSLFFSVSLFLYRVCMWTIGIYKEALKDRRHFVFILDINLWTKNFFFYLHFLSLWIDLEKKIFFFDFYFLSRKKETKIIVFAVYLFKRFEIIETKSI